MKLSQLYADKNFKSIAFNDGLNLVLAKVTKKLDRNRDSHNLGKTTLISLLDFMLLNTLDNEHIFKKHQNVFANYTFYLEIRLNSGSYLTIKRGVDNPTKISFKSAHLSQNLMSFESWDTEDLSQDAAEKYLNECLGFDVLTNWNYRKSVTYFLRSQKDYNDVFQLEKFSKGKAVYWKPFMFDLLGFDGQLLQEKYEAEERIAQQKSFIGKIKHQFSVDTDEVDKIKGAIELKKFEQSELQNQIDNFNFYQQERKLNKELVEEIETKIAELNTAEYNIEYDLEKMKSSFSQNVAFDVENLKRIYEEAKIFFPDNLVKNYQDLANFNQRITEERNKFLNQQIEQLTSQINQIRSSLAIYDERRNEILSVLQDKDSFKKFKSYQISLTAIEGDLSRLDEKLKSIDKIGVLNQVTEQLSVRLEELNKQISAQIASDDNKIYPEIRRVFNNIFRYILNAPAIIYIKQNKQGNIDFKVDVTKENELDTTAEGRGHTYSKMLCISFDMAVLLAYHKRSFYRFVYHDGSLEGLDNRKKANYITMVRQFCTKYNMQYIFTAIEHDMPADVLGTISQKELRLTLDDSGDNGKLFGFSF